MIQGLPTDPGRDWQGEKNHAQQQESDQTLEGVLTDGAGLLLTSVSVMVVMFGDEARQAECSTLHNRRVKLQSTVLEWSTSLDRHWR